MLVAKVAPIRESRIATRYKQTYTDLGEANLPLLKGQLENVRDEKNRVRQQLDQAQRQAQNISS